MNKFQALFIIVALIHSSKSASINLVEGQGVECDTDGYTIPNPNNYKTFYLCYQGNYWQISCSFGTSFDATINECRANGSPQTLVSTPCVNGQYVPHSTDRQKFYICAHGRLILHTCGYGTVYNYVYQCCDYPYNLAPQAPLTTA
jgi:hypothetical protein